MKKEIIINPEISREFQEYDKHISANEGKINSARVEIAWSLWHMDDEKFSDYIKSIGFKNISEYAKEKYGLAKTTTYEAIAVMKMAGDKGQRKLRREFDGYTFSQLRTMSSASSVVNNTIEHVEDTESVEDVLRNKIIEYFPKELSVRDMLAKKAELEKKLLVQETTEQETTEQETTEQETTEQETTEQETTEQETTEQETTEQETTEQETTERTAINELIGKLLGKIGRMGEGEIIIKYNGDKLIAKYKEKGKKEVTTSKKVGK